MRLLVIVKADTPSQADLWTLESDNVGEMLTPELPAGDRLRKEAAARH